MTRFAASLLAGAVAVATGFASPEPRVPIAVFASFESDDQRPAQPVVPTREDLSVLVDGKQHCIRGSRVLNMERMDMSVCPLKIEVLEGRVRGRHGSAQRYALADCGLRLGYRK